MGKVTWFLLILLITGGLATAYRFGMLTPEQFLYVGKLIVGWTAWTAAVAVLYGLLEKLFPGFLCSAHEDGPPPA